IAPHQTLSSMLANGEIDAMYTARAPSSFRAGDGAVRRLFEKFVDVEREYYRRTRIFPIMHTVVIRRDVYARSPWVAQSLYKAFTESKAKAYELYDQSAALPTLLPWTVAQAEDVKRDMGADWWPYGLAANK